MTLEEFRTSKRFVDDMAKELPDECWGGPAQAGYIYATHFHIEEVNAHWPDAAQQAGGWYLLLGNAEYISDDLPRLEAILYEFARPEMGWQA